MSAFIHLPPGDTWNQPDYTVIFCSVFGFLIVSLYKTEVKKKKKKETTLQSCCDIMNFIMQRGKKIDLFENKYLRLRILLYIEYV